MADDQEKYKVIKCILTTNPHGMDIHEIRRDYKLSEGQPLEESEDAALRLMRRIPDVIEEDNRFKSVSANSQHIVKLVKEQKSTSQRMQRRASMYVDRDREHYDDSHRQSAMNWAPSRGRSPQRRWNNDDRNRSKSIGRPSTSYASQLFFVQNRSASPPPMRNNYRPQNDASVHGRSLRDPRVNNNIYHSEPAGVKMDEALQTSSAITQTDKRYQRFAIIADDFLFSLILERALFASDARESMLEPKWSYCVVGQTIADAVVLVKSKNLDNGSKELPSEPVHVIVNIGAADICRGTTFCQMAKDFMELMDTCQKLNMVPTITTVLPFGATEFADEIAWKAHAFNNFLTEHFTHTIDTWSCFSIGFSRMLGTKFESNGQSLRSSGRESDLTWTHEDELMILEHRGKA